MSDVQKIIDRARELSRTKGWSKTRLAREANLGKSAMQYLDQDDFNPTADTLKAVECVLNKTNFEPVTPRQGRPLANQNVNPDAAATASGSRNG